MSNSELPKKKPGAPLGNHNARKHGVYSRRRSRARPSAAAEAGPGQPPANQLAQAGASASSAASLPPPLQRLSLSHEIDTLRTYFRRMAISGAEYAKPGQISAVLRDLSIAAVAITRLVQTEDWLAQATGIAVQYDNLETVYNELAALTRKAHPAPPPPVPVTDPEAERLFPGVHQIARDLSMSVSEVMRLCLYPDTSKKKLPPKAGQEK